MGDAPGFRQDTWDETTPRGRGWLAGCVRVYGCARSRTYISRLCMMHVRTMSSTRPLAFRLTTAEAAAITRSLLTLYTRTAPRVGVRVVSLRKFAPHTALRLHVCF